MKINSRLNENIVFIVFVFLFGCNNGTPINERLFKHIPYSGTERLLVEIDSLNTDTISLCGYDTVTQYYENSRIASDYHDFRILRCSKLNASCSPDVKYFFAYLYNNEKNEPGLGININYEEIGFFFDNELLLKDTLLYATSIPEYTERVLKLKNSHPSQSDILNVYWHTRKGLVAIETKSHGIVKIRTMGG